MQEADCQQLKNNFGGRPLHGSCPRFLGNMKLIGELFQPKMLTVDIVHSCIVKLQKDEHDESLECLCKLMSNIGKDLNTHNAKVHTYAQNI